MPCSSAPSCVDQKRLALANLRRYQSTSELHDTSSATSFALYLPNLFVALAR